MTKIITNSRKFASGRKAISKGVNMRLAIECSWKGLFRYCQVGGDFTCICCFSDMCRWIYC